MSEEQSAAAVVLFQLPLQAKTIFSHTRRRRLQCRRRLWIPSFGRFIGLLNVNVNVNDAAAVVALSRNDFLSNIEMPKRHETRIYLYLMSTRRYDGSNDVVTSTKMMS